MKSAIENLWNEYNLIESFKNGLYKKGYTHKDLFFLNFELKRLLKLIDTESLNVLNDLLRKTYFRLLVKIDKGIEYLPDIVNNPENWTLGVVENDIESWVDKDTLVFTTETKNLIFSSINRHKGDFKYIDNKWQ